MQTVTAPEGGTLDLRVGDVVEVRSQAEILATLDENGELESLPFMAEVLRYCGQRLTMYKVAHKTCDTMTRSGMRKMENAVHLTGVRCDGGGHGGCQAACLIFWKHAWLRKVDRADGVTTPAAPADAPRLPRLLPIASRRPPAQDGTELFRCQATELLRAAPEVLPIRDLGQFVQDVRSGNANVFWAGRAFLVGVYNRLPSRLRPKGGKQWGYLVGRATKTPTGRTNLQPGDLVRIKSREEIEPTLNAELLNRGMGFDSEMARMCGRTARVLRRVDHIIDERTGKMLHMKEPCIVLEGIVCEGAYNAVCPRAIPPYWREVWLDKLDGPSIPAQRDGRTDVPRPVAGTAE